MTIAKGEKFTKRYGVESFTIYKGDTSALKIPPPGHFLYDQTAPTSFDPLRVEEIDRDGKMTTPIEVWTDPDSGMLFVIDGRGRLLDVREVNRRRTEQGRELVMPAIVPFNGDEKAAVARVRIKNYHRRTPTPSGMALDLKALRDAGWPWAECAAKMHAEVEDAEQWGRRLMPLAFCIDEVRAAIDAGELPRSAATKFGGPTLDGSKKLGRKEQLALLDEMTRTKHVATPRVKGVPAKARERLRHALGNGASEGLKGLNREVAKIIAATLARLDGDEHALKSWPAVATIVETALAAPPKKEKAP